MKVILRHSESRVPHSEIATGAQWGYWTGNIEKLQEFKIYGDDVEFDVAMKSTGSFSIPVDCDVEVEMKFKFTQKTPKSVTTILQ